MGEQKNLIMALGLSMLVMFVFNEFYFTPKLEKAQRQQAALAPQQQSQGNIDSDSPVPVQTGPASTMPTLDNAAPSQALSLDDALATSDRVMITTPELNGSLSLTGALLDDLSLVNHMTTMDDDAEQVRLLSPKGAASAYYTRFGWLVSGLPADQTPNDKTVWAANKTSLTPGNPVTLTWDNGAGVTFRQVISIDDQFMFTVDQSVDNRTDRVISVAAYGQAKREGLPETDGIYILHEGPIGVLGGELIEKTYGDLEDDGDFQTTSEGGWLGITDKFWMTIMIPDLKDNMAAARFIRKGNNSDVSHRIEFITNAQQVQPGSSIGSVNHLYAGAKIVNAIDGYEETLNIPLFNRTIDWGMFHFFTRPIFKALHFLFELVGNFGVAILLMTVLIKAVLYPLANKQYVSMAHMKKVQPKIKAMQERYKEDKPKLQQEMMALYKKEKINPLAGCLPIFIQIPIFFSLYKVLYVTIEMRHQPFFGWITDLSAKDPMTPLNLFGFIPWDPPSIIAIGIWPIFMGLTMWLQQKMNPQQMEPAQQKIMNMLPIMFTFILANFSAGLVIYWTWNSVLSIAQQWVIMRREDAKSS